MRNWPVPQIFIPHTFFLKFIILYVMEQLLSTFILPAKNLLFGTSSASSNKFLDLKLKHRTINMKYFIFQVLSTRLQENTSKWNSQPKGHT